MMMNIKKIKPMFTALVTTMNTYSSEEQFIDGTNLIDGRKTKYTVKEYQKVIAVGPNVRDIKVGDIVCIDPTRFGKMVHNPGKIEEATVKDNPVVEYIFDIVELDGKPCLYLQDRDIKFIVEEFEQVQPKIKVSSGKKIKVLDKHIIM